MDYQYPDAADPLATNSAHAMALQLTGGGKRVLELGAWSGHVTVALKQAGNHVVAVELDGRMEERLADIADEVVITDLDWLDLEERLAGRAFDVIVAGDVLEHCREPDLVMLQLRRLLAPGGYVVISLPNVAHSDVRLALLAGRFDYGDVGLLDRTHLRFFTRRTIEELLGRNGFEGTEWFSTYLPLGRVKELQPLDPNIPQAAIDFVAADRDSAIYQFVVRAVPTSDPAPAAHTSPSPDVRVAEMMAKLALLRSQVAERDARIRGLDDMILAANADRLRAEQALAEHTAATEAALADAKERHLREITRIHSSRAWRFASLVSRVRRSFLPGPRRR